MIRWKSLLRFRFKPLRKRDEVQARIIRQETHTRCIFQTIKFNEKALPLYVNSPPFFLPLRHLRLLLLIETTDIGLTCSKERSVASHCHYFAFLLENMYQCCKPFVGIAKNCRCVIFRPICTTWISSFENSCIETHGDMYVALSFTIALRCRQRWRRRRRW